jgi:hypothetical protein
MFLDALIYGIRRILTGASVPSEAPTRSTLWFRGNLTVTDDPTNKRTIVDASGSSAPTGDGDVHVNMANTNQTVSTTARIMVVTSTPPMTAPRTLTVDAPAAGAGYRIIVHHDGEDTLHVTNGAGSPVDVPPACSMIITVLSTGTRAAVTAEPTP